MSAGCEGDQWLNAQSDRQAHNEANSRFPDVLTQIFAQLIDGVR